MPLRIDGRKAFKVRRGYARLGVVAPADMANENERSTIPSGSLVNWTVCVGRTLVYGSMEKGGATPTLSSLRCLDSTVPPALMEVTQKAIEAALGKKPSASANVRLVIASADGCPAEACVLAMNCAWILCRRDHVPCHVVTMAAHGSEYVLDPCRDEVEDAVVECFAVSKECEEVWSVGGPLSLGLWVGGRGGGSETPTSFLDEISPLIHKASLVTMFGETLMEFQKAING